MLRLAVFLVASVVLFEVVSSESPLKFVFCGPKGKGKMYLPGSGAVCCDGVTYYKRAHGRTACCGKNSFDPDRFICCKAKHIQPKSFNRKACCGINSFNPKYLQCCREGLIIPKRALCPPLPPPRPTPIH